MEMFIRSDRNPIIKPNKSHIWENAKVYNPGAIFHDGRYHLFYRGVGGEERWKSVIGYAASKDGETFTRQERPLLEGKADYETRGLEDPRVARIDDKFYMTYAAYDGVTPRLCMALSDDLKAWKKLGPVLPFFRFSDYGGIKSTMKHGKRRLDTEWSKSGALFPEKVNGKYMMLFGEFRIWLAASDNGLEWDIADKQPFIGPRQGFFDDNYVEMGPPPIKTEKGWLVIYHGIDEDFVYRLGFLLLDKEEPSRILYRSPKPVFWPKTDYELEGMIDILPGGWQAMDSLTEKQRSDFLAIEKRKGHNPLVVFCCGAVVREGLLRIYYGAGDLAICTACARLEDIISEISLSK